MFRGQYVCQVHVYKWFVGVQIPVYRCCSPKGITRSSANVQTSCCRYQNQSWDINHQASLSCTQGRLGSWRANSSFSWAIWITQGDSSIQTNSTAVPWVKGCLALQFNCQINSEEQQEKLAEENETGRVSVLWQCNQSFASLPCIFSGSSAHYFLQLRPLTPPH